VNKPARTSVIFAILAIGLIGVLLDAGLARTPAGAGVWPTRDEGGLPRDRHVTKHFPASGRAGEVCVSSARSHFFESAQGEFVTMVGIPAAARARC